MWHVSVLVTNQPRHMNIHEEHGMPIQHVAVGLNRLASSQIFVTSRALSKTGVCLSTSHFSKLRGIANYVGMNLRPLPVEGYTESRFHVGCRSASGRQSQNQVPQTKEKPHKLANKGHQHWRTPIRRIRTPQWELHILPKLCVFVQNCPRGMSQNEKDPNPFLSWEDFEKVQGFTIGNFAETCSRVIVLKKVQVLLVHNKCFYLSWYRKWKQRWNADR